MDNEQYFLRTFTWRSISKLYEQLCYIISTKTKKKLEKRKVQYLKIAKKHNLYFKQAKYDLDTKEIHILGVVAGWGEVQIKNDKVNAVKKWKTLSKIKEVESFLGFINFYKCFIKNFSHMAKHLNELKGKKEWKWKKEYQKAF